MAEPETLGARVRRLREQVKGWTPEDLSHFSGVPAGTIIMVEKERTKDPRASTVAALARAFGITVDELLGMGEGDGLDQLIPFGNRRRRRGQIAAAKLSGTSGAYRRALFTGPKLRTVA